MGGCKKLTMKKKMIELRKFLEEKKDGEFVSFHLLEVCRHISDEATKDKDEMDRWHKFRKKNKIQSEFIRLLFIDFLILSTK